MLSGLSLGRAHDDLLVGLGDGDDGAVVQIDGDGAVVLTTDFFTPVVDSAYDWGRIAAANALSDIYASGEPLGVGTSAAFESARVAPWQSRHPSRWLSS